MTRIMALPSSHASAGLLLLSKIFTPVSRTLLLMNCICRHSALAKFTISRYWLSANRIIGASLQKQSTLGLQLCELLCCVTIQRAELKGQGQITPSTSKSSQKWHISHNCSYSLEQWTVCILAAASPRGDGALGGRAPLLRPVPPPDENSAGMLYNAQFKALKRPKDMNSWTDDSSAVNWSTNNQQTCWNVAAYIVQQLQLMEVPSLSSPLSLPSLYDVIVIGWQCWHVTLLV